MNEQLFSRDTPLAQNLSSIDKGKIVERIVALMHKYPDTSVKVERNVHLPSILNKKSRKREIDVLLTREIAGHTIQIAIECKNEKRPIDTPAIDTFIKKLHHMLFFALATGIRPNRTHIFEIDLHLCQWLKERFLTMLDGWISQH